MSQSRRAVDREEQWRAALSALDFTVTHVMKSEGGRYLWIMARDMRADTYRPVLKIVDAWDDGNDAWSYGFSLSVDGEENESISYDSERVSIPWMCSEIEARR